MYGISLQNQTWYLYYSRCTVHVYRVGEERKHMYIFIHVIQKSFNIRVLYPPEYSHLNPRRPETGAGPSPPPK